MRRDGAIVSFPLRLRRNARCTPCNRTRLIRAERGAPRSRCRRSRCRRRQDAGMCRWTSLKLSAPKPCAVLSREPLPEPIPNGCVDLFARHAGWVDGDLVDAFVCNDGQGVVGGQCSPGLERTKQHARVDGVDRLVVEELSQGSNPARGRVVTEDRWADWLRRGGRRVRHTQPESA